MGKHRSHPTPTDRFVRHLYWPLSRDHKIQFHASPAIIRIEWQNRRNELDQMSDVLWVIKPAQRRPDSQRERAEDGLYVTSRLTADVSLN